MNRLRVQRPKSGSGCRPQAVPKRRWRSSVRSVRRTRRSVPALPSILWSISTFALPHMDVHLHIQWTPHNKTTVTITNRFGDHCGSVRIYSYYTPRACHIRLIKSIDYYDQKGPIPKAGLFKLRLMYSYCVFRVELIELFRINCISCVY